MHPADCPSWEYTNNPLNNQVLYQRTALIIRDLRSAVADTLRLSVDSRPFHGFLFEQLTPDACDYYAGHYRGEPYRCLRFYPVGIRSDPRVGAHPNSVLDLMQQLADNISRGIIQLDYLALNSPFELLKRVVRFTCAVFELFLRIHPYVNGNGHIGRLIVLGILGRFGFWLKRWQIHPRPTNFPYVELIREYRDGNKEPLESFILRMILGDTGNI
ncbi:MAG: Fic family protein [Candidatus Tectomicrobia bacterium]|nr:Fic family protein [Candidatus Tectomicrobia bacterium]